MALVLGTEVPVLDHKTLKDGVLLLDLYNKVCPETPKKINKTTMAFKQMENISAFLKGAADLGCPASDMFQVCAGFFLSRPS
jgi:hypothetical protein